MYVALGFVAATLIALLIIPAINARAERLARRRAEALFPMSISELNAEKDHLRAEFAVLQRQLERKAEEAMAVKHRAMEELGRRAVRIDQLETELSERDAAIAGLQNDLATMGSHLSATEDELASVKASLAATRDTLAAIEEAHRKTLDELAATRGEYERTNTMFAGSRADLLLTQDQLNVRDSAFSDLERRYTAALSELDTKRITISDLETRLAMQTGRGDDFERAMNERRAELEQERRRLTELAKDLLAEQERALALEQRVRELEAERNSRAAESASSDEIRAENAELRRRISEVADEVMQAVGRKGTSPASDRRKRAG
jgi:chromosome segregation ATPase